MQSSNRQVISSSALSRRRRTWVSCACDTACVGHDSEAHYSCEIRRRPATGKRKGVLPVQPRQRNHLFFQYHACAQVFLTLLR
jgi:hypothetical protein